MKRWSLAILFLATFAALGYGVAFAQLRDATDSGGVLFPNPLACDNFGCVASKIIKALYQIAIPVVAIMVLIGGFQMLTAGGNEERFSTGKKTILYAVVGTVAIILASGVVGIIESALGGPGG